MSLIKKDCKSVLTDRGYAIIKDMYPFKDVQRCRDELNVKPFVHNAYNDKEVLPYPIYLESSKKIYVPKHYGLEHFGEPNIIKIKKGHKSDIAFKGSLRDKQKPVVKSFLATCKNDSFKDNSMGGIISVPCGWGKTIMALYIISKLKRKTLIVVHKEFLLNQWIERIHEFLPDASIGIIQGSKIDIKGKDIVLGMLQSLSQKDYPKNLFKDFGLTIVDECHHIAAEVFSRSLPKINSYYSLGLSATPNRVDGLTKVFTMFLGPIVYRIAKDDKCVAVKVIEYNEPFNKAYAKEEVLYNGRICLPRMVNNICECHNRNKLIVCLGKSLYKQNKQTLILSDRRVHLQLLHEELSKVSTVGYYMGGMKQKDLKKSESATFILGTFPMSSEGLDIPSLDAVIFATPKSSIQQSIGRITRKEHVSMPIAYDILDNFSMFIGQYNKRLRLYKSLKYKVYRNSINISLNEILTDSKIEYCIDNMVELDFSKKKRKTSANKSECLIIED